jgi:hypothetical protein
MGVIERLTTVFDEVWEDLIYDRATALYTIMEIANIPAKWLPLMKPLLGFTSDLSFDATTAELRRILSLAVPYWNAKPTELAVIDYAIRMITGNRFRVQNFFDFRMQIEKTQVGEELEDFDPHAIDFPSEIFHGQSLIIGEAGNDFFNCSSEYPNNFTNNQFAWLLIIDDPTDPLNNGLHKIKLTISGTKTGRIFGTFNSIHANPIEYKLYDWMDDFVTEVRLVDESVGTINAVVVTIPVSVGERVYGQVSGAKGVVTSVAAGIPSEVSLRRIRGRFEPREQVLGDLGGDVEIDDNGTQDVLNRELIRFLMSSETVRPFGERIDIVYTSFLDCFLTKGDLDQWLTVGGVANLEGGYAWVEASGFMLSANPNGVNWEDQVTLFKLEPQTVDAIARLILFGQDSDNYYYVTMDYDNKRVGVFKLVAGVPTQIGSWVSVPYVKIFVQDVVRVEAFKDGTGTRFRVKVNGDLELDEIDDPFAFEKGQVGAYGEAGTYKLKLTEVITLPTDVERVGLNP